jgi:hypothetical protein
MVLSVEAGWIRGRVGRDIACVAGSRRDGLAESRGRQGHKEEFITDQNEQNRRGPEASSMATALGCLPGSHVQTTVWSA